MYKLILVVFTSYFIFSCISTSDKVPHPSFLKSTYKVQGNNERFFVRQVPGNGACLFNALATCLRYKQCLRHLDFDDTMKDISLMLRKISVHVLMQENMTLTMADSENITTTALLTLASDSYNMSQKAYLTTMSHPRTWGGGPEIVALSNYLKRPICVYQLCVSSLFGRYSSFEFKLAGRFGAESQGCKSPLYILCADGRFPNVEPGQHKEIGDHFLALFPFCSSDSGRHLRQASHAEARGGMQGRDRPLGPLKWLQGVLPWTNRAAIKAASEDDVAEPDVLSFMEDENVDSLAARLEAIQLSGDDSNVNNALNGTPDDKHQQSPRGTLPHSADSEENAILSSKSRR